MPASRFDCRAGNEGSASPDDLSERILALLSPVPVPEDQLLRDLGLTVPVAAHMLARHLSELELNGSVARRPGGALVRL